jgi:hypothetical protein
MAKVPLPLFFDSKNSIAKPMFDQFTSKNDVDDLHCAFR